MKTRSSVLLIVLAIILASCGGEKSKSKVPTPKPQVVKKVTKKVPASQRVDLSGEGVGEIHGMELTGEIDQTMAKEGEELFKLKCTACHKTDKKFIGPALKGVLSRRSPSWVMNMILDPEKMVKNDPLAKDLLVEYNGSPMANQGLTKEEARAILEYFRTLK